MIINESNNKGNKYCVKFKIGDKVRFIHPGGKLSKEIATITGYDKDGFYTYTWSDGEKSNGSSDINFSKINEDTVKKANGKWTNRGKDGEHDKAILKGSLINESKRVVLQNNSGFEIVVFNNGTVTAASCFNPYGEPSKFVAKEFYQKLYPKKKVDYVDTNNGYIEFNMSVDDTVKELRKISPYYKIIKNESMNEDVVQKKNGKWTNRGNDGTEHGEFDTKEQALAQMKAMYANGYKS